MREAATLRKIADRVEALGVPSREIECEIGVKIGWFRTEQNKGWPDRTDYIDIRGEGECYPGHGFDQLVPDFTHRLDEALTLAPMGWEWTIESGGHAEMLWHRLRGPFVEGNAVTPALAFVAAALRARAAMSEEAQ